MSYGTLWSASTVTSSDGTRLAVYEAGPRDAPTILAVHGYPDDHHVWDGLVELLATSLRVVSFDVRGAGASDVPGHRAAYRLDQLAADIALVAQAHGPDPVHLLAHDWGSIQAWYAATRGGADRRFASLISISGPDLAHCGAWFRRGLRRYPLTVLRQARRSWYIFLFRVPGLPELIWRSRIGHRVTGSSAPSRSVRDAVHGLQLYRANMKFRAGPGPRRCALPVMVVAPAQDRYVTVDLQVQAPVPWTPDLVTHKINGGHWVIAGHPEQLHPLITDFIRAHPAAAGQTAGSA